VLKVFAKNIHAIKREWICSHPVAMPPTSLPSDDALEIRSAIEVINHGAAKTQ
jgi:hypothetical protein